MRDDLGVTRHSEMPVSDSYHDLVMALADKLESTRLYGGYERHAQFGGKPDIATLFSRIASRDRHSIEELMQSLREHQEDERTGRTHSTFSAD